MYKLLRFDKLKVLFGTGSNRFLRMWVNRILVRDVKVKWGVLL